MAISSHSPNPEPSHPGLGCCSVMTGSFTPNRPFGGPEHALRYLGNYTHRVAISNHRLVALTNEDVTFRWRDSAHGNKKRLMTLSVDEFLRRFLLHLLPRGFVRIRNFGFLANRQRAQPVAALLPLTSGSREHPSYIRSPFTRPCSPTLEVSRVRRHHACPRAALSSSTPAPFSATQRIRRLNPQLHPRSLLVSAHAYRPCVSRRSDHLADHLAAGSRLLKIVLPAVPCRQNRPTQFSKPDPQITRIAPDPIESP